MQNHRLVWGETSDQTSYSTSTIDMKFVVELWGGEELLTYDCNGNLKHWSTKSKKLLTNYTANESSESEVCSISATNDNLWFYTGDSLGNLKQYSALNRVLHHDFGKVHKMAIKIIHCTQNSEIMLSADLKGDIRVWSIRDTAHIKNLVKAHPFPITSIVSTKLCDTFITSDCVGNIKFWS